MPFWTMMIYAGAAAIAIQGLFALMTAHRQNSLQKYFAEESRKHAEQTIAAESLKPETNIVSARTKTS